jgi:hypothetical protein
MVKDYISQLVNPTRVRDRPYFCRIWIDYKDPGTPGGIGRQDEWHVAARAWRRTGSGRTDNGQSKTRPDIFRRIIGRTKEYLAPHMAWLTADSLYRIYHTVHLSIHLEDKDLPIHTPNILHLDLVTFLSTLNKDTISLSKHRLAAIAAHPEHGVLPSRLARGLSRVEAGTLNQLNVDEFRIGCWLIVESDG